MSELMSDQPHTSIINRLPGAGRRVSVLGVPCAFGASVAGVDLGPAAMRVARLNQRIAQLGYEVRDLGDVRPNFPAVSNAEPTGNVNFLEDIAAIFEDLSSCVKKIVYGGEIPIILVGDHSIAIG